MKLIFSILRLGHGARWYRGSTTGEFAFGVNIGDVENAHGSRLIVESL